MLQQQNQEFFSLVVLQHEGRTITLKLNARHLEILDESSSSEEKLANLMLLVDCDPFLKAQLALQLNTPQREASYSSLTCPEHEEELRKIAKQQLKDLSFYKESSHSSSAAASDKKSSNDNCLTPEESALLELLRLFSYPESCDQCMNLYTMLTKESDENDIQRRKRKKNPSRYFRASS